MSAINTLTSTNRSCPAFPATPPKKKPRLSYTSSQRDGQVEEDGKGVNPQAAATGRVDPTYGQRSAFPGLDDDDDEDASGDKGGREGGGAVFYGPAADGMAYLKMVR